MYITKKLFSAFLALCFIMSTIAVVTSVTASAADDKPVYLTTFTKNNFTGWGSYAESANSDEMVEVPAKSITYNADNSFRMDSDGPVAGTSAIFKLDAGANDAWKTMVKNTAAEQKPTFYIKTYVANAQSESGIHLDTQFTLYAEFKDGKEGMFTSVHYLDMYQTKLCNFVNEVKIPIVDENGEEVLDSTGEATYEVRVLKDLSDVVSFKVEMYHWEEMMRAMVISSPTISGTPSIPELDPIVVKDGVKTATFCDFDPSYRKDYGNSPYAIKYSPDNAEKYTKKNKGWIEMTATSDWVPAQNQWQAFYKFNRDTANYALAVANKKDNSHFMQVTVYLESCVDKEGKDVMGQVLLTFSTYEDGYIDGVKNWQKAGTSATYYLDMSKYDRNSITGVRVGVQNYCFYAEDGTVVDLLDTDDDGTRDTYYDLDGKVYGNTKDGKKYSLISINAKMYMSPITVCEKTPEGFEPATEVVTTTTEAPTTAPVIKEVEGAGYRFLPITFDNEDKIFGNSPESAIITETGKTTTVQLGSQKFIGATKAKNNLVVDDFYKGYVLKIKSPKKSSMQNQVGFLINSDQEIDTYGEILSGGEEYDYSENIEKALEYAHNSYNLLAVDVRCNSAIHSFTKNDCGIQAEIMIHCEDSLDSVDAMDYVLVGQTKTLFLDVSELDADMVQLLRYVAQNYANTNLDTGVACGMTDVDVDYSNVYVPTAEQCMKYLGIDENGEKIDDGKKDNGVNTGLDKDLAEELYNIYKQLPGTMLEDYTTYDQYLLLDEFVTKYVDASTDTQKYLDTEYGITDMIYSDLLWTWQDLDITILDGYPGFGGSTPSTGDATPISVFVFAVLAAGAVVTCKRRK